MRLIVTLYRGADKSLARPWKETSYGDQDSQNYTKTFWHTNNRNFARHKSWYGVVSWFL